MRERITAELDLAEETLLVGRHLLMRFSVQTFDQDIVITVAKQTGERLGRSLSVLATFMAVEFAQSFIATSYNQPLDAIAAVGVDRHGALCALRRIDREQLVIGETEWLDGNSSLMKYLLPGLLVRLLPPKIVHVSPDLLHHLSDTFGRHELLKAGSIH